MNYIKVLIARLLANSITGYVIRKLLNDKILTRNATIKTNSKFITNTTCAHIFFKLYESSEIKFALKYIQPNSTIVELGGSIGVVSSVLMKNVKNLKYYCVEANEGIMDVLERNLAVNAKENYRLYNYAIVGMDNKSPHYFNPGSDSTTGKISFEKTNHEISALSLSEFLSSNKIKRYTLICDIEGAEIEIIENDKKAFEKCEMIIIELHKKKYEVTINTIEEIRDKIINMGFSILDRHGPNYVFHR